MSAYKDQKGEDEAPAAAIHKIRITLSGHSVQHLESICRTLVTTAKDKKLNVKGPMRMPTKTLRITTRKTPCGEGSKTWDRFQMRIYKRLIDLYSPAETVKQITNVVLQSGVKVEITIAE